MLQTYLVLSVFLTAAWGMPAAAPAYEVSPVPDGGSLTGSVKFAGAPPRLDPLPVRKNQDICGQSVPNEALILGLDSGVRGSVVLIEGVPRGKKGRGGAGPGQRPLSLRPPRVRPDGGGFGQDQEFRPGPS